MKLSSIDFEFLRKFVMQHSAIELRTGKEYLVEARLHPVLRAGGFASYRALTDRLKTQPFGDLHRDVVDAMTTNETSFFRDLRPFTALQNEVLPGLIERRQNSRRLRIWSAACSSGQEPYSLAMMIRENFPELNGWNIEIFATDISRRMVERARDADYSQLEVNRGLPIRLLMKNFRKQGVRWRLKDEIRGMVSFRRLNLARPWVDVPVMDLILMRNVLYYFNDTTRQGIVNQVRKHVASDGFFFLGGAEVALSLDSNFKRLHIGKAICYAPF